MSLIMDVLNHAMGVEEKKTADTTEVKEGLRTAPAQLTSPAIGEKIQLHEYSSNPESLEVLNRKSFIRALLLTSCLILGAWYGSHWVVQYWQIEPVFNQREIIHTAPWSNETSFFEEQSAGNLPVVEAKAIKPEPIKPQLKLEGVVIKGADPICLINGKMHRIGDIVLDHEILRINKEEVTLADPSGQILRIPTNG